MLIMVRPLFRKLFGFESTLVRRERLRQFYRPRVEALEDRTLPASVPLDPLFGPSGVVVGVGNMATDVAVQRDGRVLVAYRGDVVRYETDGEVDSGFGTNGHINLGTFGPGDDPALSVAVLTDGRLVVAGLAVDTATGL